MPVENFSNFQATITPLTGDYLVGYTFADPVNKLNPFETRTTLKQIFDSYTSYSSNLSGITPNQLSTGHPSWDQYGNFTIPNQLTVNGAPSYFGNGTIRASIYPDNSNNGVTIESADYANVNKKDLYLASRGGNVAIGTVTPKVSGLTISGNLSASGNIYGNISSNLSGYGGISLNTINNKSVIDSSYLLSLIQSLSSNMQNIGNYPYLEYGWVCAPNVAGQTVAANTITTLSCTSEVSDLYNYGSISNHQITLAAGTYTYEAWTGLDFGGSGGGAMAGFGLYNITNSSYISRTGPESAVGAAFYSLRLNGQFTINTSTVFDIRAWSNSAFKVHNSGGDTSITLATPSSDQRTTLKLWKVG